MHEPEKGTLRPPSEARSLLIRVVRNCHWNRCAFCPAYKGEKFSLRSVEEIVAEVSQITSQPCGNLIKNVFLQDADALIMPVEKLMMVLNHIRQGFPGLERITTYGRSTTLVRRSVKDLERLKEAGLSRVHVGLESGSDEVLKMVRKGATAAQHLEGCSRVRAAGLELCCYVMPGLGGRRYSERHARESGRLVADIRPTHVRLRTCFVLEGTPLADDFAEGRFEPIDDEATVREIRIFLEQLASTETELISDHRINLLLELQGKLPGEYDHLCGIIDRFLALGDEERELFIIGRRLGLIRRLDELSVAATRETVARERHRYRAVVPLPRGILY